MNANPYLNNNINSLKISNFIINLPNNLTLLELKFFYKTLEIQQNSPNTLAYVSHPNEFKPLINNGKKVPYVKMNKVFEGLATKLIPFHKNSEEEFTCCPYLAAVIGKANSLIFQPSEAIRPYIFTDNLNNDLAKEGYTEFKNTANFNNFTSVISLKMYFILYSKSFKSKEVILTTKQIYNYFGIKNDYYNDYFRFNEKFLKKIQADMLVSDLKIAKYEPIKVNGKVESIRFIVEKMPCQNEVQKVTCKQSLQVKKPITEPIQEQPQPIQIQAKPIEIIEQKEPAKEIYSKKIQDLIDLGITASTAKAMYSKDCDRISAIYANTMQRYHTKSNGDKCRIIVANFNNGIDPRKQEIMPKTTSTGDLSPAEYTAIANAKIIAQKLEVEQREILAGKDALAHLKQIQDLAEIYRKLDEPSKIDILTKTIGKFCTARLSKIMRSGLYQELEHLSHFNRELIIPLLCQKKMSCNGG